MRVAALAARWRRLTASVGGACCAAGVALIAWAAAFGSPPVTVIAASGGDANAGTIKVSNVGDAATNDNDPQLTCVDIDIWGSHLADASGTFTVVGWPPTGSKETDGSGTWSYDTAAGGLQVIAVVPVSTLMAAATGNGDTSANRGFHFKVELTQDPSKFKTFWLACSGGAGGSSSSTTSSSTSTTQTSPTSTTTTSTTSTSTTTSTTVSTTTSTVTSTQTTTVTSTITVPTTVTATVSATSTPTSSTSTPTGAVSGLSASSSSPPPPAATAASTAGAIAIPDTGAGNRSIELVAGTALIVAGALLVGLSPRRRPPARPS